MEKLFLMLLFLTAGFVGIHLSLSTIGARPQLRFRPGSFLRPVLSITCGILLGAVSLHTFPSSPFMSLWAKGLVLLTAPPVFAFAFTLLAAKADYPGEAASKKELFGNAFLLMLAVVLLRLLYAN